MRDYRCPLHGVFSSTTGSCPKCFNFSDIFSGLFGDWPAVPLSTPAPTPMPTSIPSLVERLTKRWENAAIRILGPNPRSMIRRKDMTDSEQARWWLLAIADEIHYRDRKLADWLREQAKKVV